MKNEGGSGDEGVGAEKPAKITDRQENCSQAGIEVTRSDDVDIGDARGKPVCAFPVALRFRHHRQCSEQDGVVVEQPIGPAKLEKRITKDRRETAGFHFEGGACARHEQRHVVKQQLRPVGLANQRKTAADGEDRGRGEKRGAILKPGHDLGIDHLQITRQRVLHPAPAVNRHRLGEAHSSENTEPPANHSVEQKPAADKENKRE